MTIKYRQLIPALSFTIITAIGAFNYGVAAGQNPNDLEAKSSKSIEGLSETGGTVQLSSSQIEIFSEFSQSLDPEDATFDSNIALSPAEVDARTEVIGETYEIGEALSIEDLEFLRIYAFSTGENKQDVVVEAGILGSKEPIVKPAFAANKPLIELVDDTTVDSFYKSKTLYGTSANISGSMRLTIGTTISNSWSATWTAKKVSGASTTKIVSKANIYAYGAVAAWPFIGLVYETHPSASTTSQSLGFSRTGNFSAFVAYMTGECTSVFYNTNGSFQI